MHRYADRRHLSYREAIRDPWPEIERAFVIWSLDDEHDKLETKRQEMKYRSKT